MEAPIGLDWWWECSKISGSCPSLWRETSWSMFWMSPGELTPQTSAVVTLAIAEPGQELVAADRYKSISLSTKSQGLVFVIPRDLPLAAILPRLL